ncbi:MAG: glycerol-3-phosphate acyltransferase [Acidimicrobiia bacterium]
MTVLAGLAGYLIGSIPTASMLGHLMGVHLRKDGSGNPGTKNALAIRGPSLAAIVLLIEAAKGFGAVWLGWALAGDPGAVAAAITAVAGNVYNIWYRFEGGKGLGISLGILAGVWPTVLPVMVVVIVTTVLLTRSAGLAALATMAGFIVSAIVWTALGLPTGGVATGAGLIALAIGMTAVLIWKHWRDSPLNPAWSSEQRTPA